MPSLVYSYRSYPAADQPRPIIPCIAVNILNGKSVEFFAIVDSGADQTALTEDIFEDLEVDLDNLPRAQVGGGEGTYPTVVSDFLKIAFIEESSEREFWPNKSRPVPAHLIHGPFCLLGRESLLDLCVVTFDGPSELVTVAF